MTQPDELDDDTVLSALLPIDRTVVSAGNGVIDEKTIIGGTNGELDEKTRAVERRALNTDPALRSGARVAFTPEEKRERYAVRKDASVLPSVARITVAAPPARTPGRAPRERSGALVVVAVVAVTLVVAVAVAGILMLVLRM